MHPFSYIKAKSLADAAALLQAHPDAKLMSGGMTLLPTLKQGLAQPSHLIDIAGIAVARQPLAIVLIGGALTAALWFLLERTQAGRRMRAVAADRHMARAVGIPVARYVTLSLALAGALAGIAGFLLGYQFLVTPTQGAGYMLKAYIAIAIGGWGSVPGALLGALGIGFFETFVSAAVGDAWASTALYVGVIALLLLRPSGLFGEPAGRRA